MTENGTLVATKIDWPSLSGIILDGGCELKEPLELRDDAAKMRIRILGSGGQSGTAFFLALDKKEADDQLDIWETLREVQHPNLAVPLAVGRRQLSGVDVIYLVLPDPDEKLAAVVPERSLEWEEAAEALHSIEKGLAHLHAWGLVHGSVSPETVQAVGYTIQLSTEGVRRLGTKPQIEWSKPRYLAPESRDANITVAADVWCLGATLFEVLAQQPYGSPGAELEKGLPLAAVIARCLDKNPVTRCSLKEAPAAAAAPVEELPPPTQTAPPPEMKQPDVVAEAVPPAPVGADPLTAAPTAPPDNDPPKPAVATPLPPPARKPVETRAPAPAATARTTSASRLPQPLTPHPLTPKPAPRQVTKEDMALVPVGKRHKRVQGKRAPVDARIRTLDGPSLQPGEETIAASGPAVAARTLVLGTKSNFVRGIVAGVGLMALFVAAIWFIIIPKLQSPAEPAVTSDSAQTASLSASEASTAVPVPKGSEVTTNIPIPPQALNPDLQDSPSKNADAPTERRAKPQRFRVVLSSFNNQQDAVRRLLTLNQEHPDLLFHVVSPKSGDGPFLVVAGGLLSRSEADELHQRVVGKGIKAAHVEPLKE